MFFSHSAIANLPKVSFDYSQEKIEELLSSQRDYLSSKEIIESIYLASQSEDWGHLSLKAALVYSEYLFRAEQYEPSKNHLNKALAKDLLKQHKSLYLLAKELQVKLLLTSSLEDEATMIVEELVPEINDASSEQQIILYRLLAYYYTEVDRIADTLVAANKGLELATQTKSDAAQGFFLRKIADSHNYLNDKETANRFALESLAAFQKTADGFSLSKANWSVGNSFMDLGQANKAKPYFEEALAYFKSQQVFKGIVFSQYSLSNILLSNGEFDKALVILKDNVVWAKQAGIDDMKLASMISIGHIYQQQGKWQDANDINDEVYNMISSFSRSAYKANFLSDRRTLKKQLGNIEQALDASEQELIYFKAYMQEVTQDKIRSLQVQLDVKDKEQQLLELAKENSIIELKANESRQNEIIWRLTAFMSVLVFTIVCIILYWVWQQRKRYRTFALLDDLTQAPNRRSVIQLAKEALKEHQSLTIAIADLDNFKSINDSYGHEVGDAVLIDYAQAAKQSIREIDCFGRYGGEEWMFVFKTEDQAIVLDIFNRIRIKLNELVQERNLDNFPTNRVVTFSMGATINHRHDSKVDRLIQAADDLLYKAKGLGRDKLVFDDMN